MLSPGNSGNQGSWQSRANGQAAQALLELKGIQELIESADQLAACLYRLTHPQRKPAAAPVPG